MNRAFGRRAGMLPDGRTYQPGVFYCRDVFEGLQTLDAFFDPSARETLPREHAELGPSTTTVRTPGRRADIGQSEPPRPPRLGPRRIEADLRSVWEHLDLNTLFRHHWGGFPVRGTAYDRLVQDVFEPELRRLQTDAERDGWLEPLMVGGHFECHAEADSLIVQDVRFEFPRQPDGERLCLADYFSAVQDVVPLQAVSTGPRPARYMEALEREGKYVRMLYVNGLSAATAEAMADFAHAQARRDLGLPPRRSLRFSWGYAACPDLSQQRQLVRLLNAEHEIGLRLTESDTLDPEHSTAALVVHHPDIKYFSVLHAS
jgi:5-methyltetrahydrofolate--homocysteine methyltransferase